MLKASDGMGCMMGHKVRTNVNAQSSTISALLIASVSISAALTACSPSSTPPSTTSQSASTTASSANGNHASNTDATPNASIATAAVPNQLTIYTSIDKAALEPLLTSYARQINVPIHIVQDEPMSILARLKAEGANSPADVILTEDAGVFLALQSKRGCYNPLMPKKQWRMSQSVTVILMAIGLRYLATRVPRCMIVVYSIPMISQAMPTCRNQNGHKNCA